MNRVDNYLRQALAELDKLNTGEVFFVRELWKGYEWNRIPIEERLLLGRVFYNDVTQQDPCPVTILDKTKAGQQKYQKN